MRYVGGFREPDPRTLADFGERRAIAGDPERPARIEGNAVLIGTDVERFAQTSGASRKIAVGDPGAVRTHCIESGNRFERSDQHGGPHASGFGRHVHTERGTVDEVDVRMPRFKKHGAVALRLATVGVRGGIARRIGLRLDDPADQLDPVPFAHKQQADQEARKPQRVEGEAGARDRIQRLGRDGE